MLYNLGSCRVRQVRQTRKTRFLTSHLNSSTRLLNLINRYPKTNMFFHSAGTLGIAALAVISPAIAFTSPCVYEAYICGYNLIDNFGIQAFSLSSGKYY